MARQYIKLEDAVRARLGNVRGLLESGKGEYGKTNYRADDIWRQWMAIERALSDCLYQAGLKDEGRGQ